jgi:hypothetical protein
LSWIFAAQDLAAQEKELRSNNNNNRDGEVALAEREAAMLKKEQELQSRYAFSLCTCVYV